MWAVRLHGHLSKEIILNSNFSEQGLLVTGPFLHMVPKFASAQTTMCQEICVSLHNVVFFKSQNPHKARTLSIKIQL